MRYKYFINLFILMLIYVVFTGCQEEANGQSEDIRYTYYKDGKVESTTEYKNGYRNGYRKFFDEEGRVVSETIYVNGKREGVMKAFYPDGSLRMTGKYVNDILEGEMLTFYPNSQLETRKFFEKGRMVSNIKYTPEGEIEFEDKF
jgi:antitoxin component YwqK of YwqJK toxin-antitoxin module